MFSDAPVRPPDTRRQPLHHEREMARDGARFLTKVRRDFVCEGRHDEAFFPLSQLPGSAQSAASARRRHREVSWEIPGRLAIGARGAVPAAEGNWNRRRRCDAASETLGDANRRSSSSRRSMPNGSHGGAARAASAITRRNPRTTARTTSPKEIAGRGLFMFQARCPLRYRTAIQFPNNHELHPTVSIVAAPRLCHGSRR